MTVSAGTWLRRYRPSPAARTRLICFPHAGGSASFFVPWANRLSPTVEVLAVQYPGRQERRAEPLVDDLQAMVEPIVDELARSSDLPWAIFGHSMGSVLGLEVAKRLADDRTIQQPAWFIASGHHAPGRGQPRGVHRLDDERLVRVLRKFQATDERFLDDDEMLRMILPIARNDFTAEETHRYRPGPTLGYPLTAMTGDDDPWVSVDDAKAWQEQTTSEFDFQVFSGGHFFLLRHQAQILQHIDGRLRDIERSASTPVLP
ncbi:thioesterase II family protein [Actinoplanes sp. NPDC049265]|uniref:thioesterase II family protein n=1 Tax=Actinoplanes sp. NPDC049265 TaxID=3363902 RepID=UPI00371D8210